MLSDLRTDRFEGVQRWYGEHHVVDESILHATARGRPFGLEGRGRQVAVRLLHVFDFGDGLIRRESAWLDFAGLQEQLCDQEARTARRAPSSERSPHTTSLPPRGSTDEHEHNRENP